MCYYFSGMTFRQREAARVFKIREHLFSPAASESLLQDREHLGRGYEHENVFTGFRDSVLHFFNTRAIKWHGSHGVPDSSIISSQVSCVNCLFQFLASPDCLAAWLRNIYEDLLEPLPIDSKGEPPLPDGGKPFLSFEWIGEEKYLKERGGGRGAFQTNADAVLRFRQQDGKIHVVLVEWKYCESDLKPKNLSISKNGTNRVAVYEPELAKPRCHLSLGNVAFKELFRSPIYQLMRLQLLASAMERHSEMQADIVSVLHIAPKCNPDILDPKFAAEFAPDCECSVSAIWGRFAPGRFRHTATEDLIPLLTQAAAQSDWASYISRRYGCIGC